MMPQRTQSCLRCHDPVPAGRFAYCSGRCQQAESHDRWIDQHPGYRAAKHREYHRKDAERINARRRKRYRDRQAMAQNRQGKTPIVEARNTGEMR